LYIITWVKTFFWQTVYFHLLILNTFKTVKKFLKISKYPQKDSNPSQALLAIASTWVWIFRWTF